MHEEEGQRAQAAELARLRQENARLTRQLELEQQLLGIVSHDLRNPLTAIHLVTTQLLRHQGLDARVVKGLVRMQSGVGRAMRLVRDLLDFTQARLSGDVLLQCQPADLHALARQALEEVHSAFPERVLQLHVEGSAQGTWDADRLLQVLGNLLTNALKYSPPESVVTVRTWGAEEGVGLSVHNAGAPIPEELLPEIFEPLRHGSGELERDSGSIGLGLFIVRHLVQVHGGSVTVRSSAQEGTTFTVALPRSVPQPLPGT